MMAKKEIEDIEDFIFMKLIYSKITGQFKKKRADRSNGMYKELGHILPSGRVMIRVLGKKYYAEDLAWLSVTGEWPAGKILHKDGDRANNKWENLAMEPSKERDELDGQYGKKYSEKEYDDDYQGCFIDRHGMWWCRLLLSGGREHIFGRSKTLGDAKAAFFKLEKYLRQASALR